LVYRSKTSDPKDNVVAVVRTIRDSLCID